MGKNNKKTRSRTQVAGPNLLKILRMSSLAIQIKILKDELHKLDKNN